MQRDCSPVAADGGDKQLIWKGVFWVFAASITIVRKRERASVEEDIGENLIGYAIDDGAQGFDVPHSLLAAYGSIHASSSLYGVLVVQSGRASESQTLFRREHGRLQAKGTTVTARHTPHPSRPLFGDKPMPIWTRHKYHRTKADEAPSPLYF